jgi:hypothetical protein
MHRQGFGPMTGVCLCPDGWVGNAYEQCRPICADGCKNCYGPESHECIECQEGWMMSPHNYDRYTDLNPQFTASQEFYSHHAECIPCPLGHCTGTRFAFEIANAHYNSAGVVTSVDSTVSHCDPSKGSYLDGSDNSCRSCAEAGCSDSTSFKTCEWEPCDTCASTNYGIVYCYGRCDADYEMVIDTNERLCYSSC